MIDLHTHVLPSVDDGADSLADSLAMCRKAAREGTATLVATPHQRSESWENADPAALESLRARLQAELGDEIRVLLGGEVRIDTELLADLEKPDRGGILSLAGSRYLLLEPGPYPPHLDLVELIHELGVGGWRGVVAHPERVAYLAEDPGLLEAMVDRGALFQLTAGSLEGVFGRRAQGCSEWMLDRGLAHVVASDAHDPALRAPTLAGVRAVLARRWGAQSASRLLDENPRAIVENRPLPGGSR